MINNYYYCKIVYFQYGIKNMNCYTIIINEYFRSGNEESITSFIKQCNQNELNLLLKISAEYGHLEIMCILINNGADIHYDNDKSLYAANNIGYLEIVKLLLKKGNYGDEILSYLLGVSIFKHRLNFVHYYVENGVKINVILLIQSYNNINVDIFKYLIKHSSIEVLEEFFNYDEYGSKVLLFFLKQNITEYHNLITTYRKTGIDVYDMIEHEL